MKPLDFSSVICHDDWTVKRMEIEMSSKVRVYLALAYACVLLPVLTIVTVH